MKSIKTFRKEMVSAVCLVPPVEQDEMVKVEMSKKELAMRRRLDEMLVAEASRDKGETVASLDFFSALQKSLDDEHVYPSVEEYIQNQVEEEPFSDDAVNDI